MKALQHSSSTYSARIPADERLRKLVVGSGALFAATGLIVLLFLPVSLELRVVTSIAWICLSVRELAHLWRVYRGCFGYRVWPGGDIEVIGDGCDARQGRILAGSVAYSGWAWVRVQVDGDRPWAELVRGKCRESQQWRHFQTIFRHLNTC